MPQWGTRKRLTRANRRGSSLRLFGRLAPAATLQGAQAEVTTVTAELDDLISLAQGRTPS